jgi:hypothetical protein
MEFFYFFHELVFLGLAELRFLFGWLRVDDEGVNCSGDNSSA